MNKIFESEFNSVLCSNEEEDFENQDAKKKLPYYFIPLLPMILINGCRGIATGFSTTIAQYDIEQIIQCLEDMIYNDTHKQKK